MNPSASTPPPLPGGNVRPTKTSRLAVASLVLGIFGCACLPAIAGLICGLMALSRIRRSNGALGGKGFALAGVIVSLVMMLLSIPILAGLLVPALSYHQVQRTEVRLDDGSTACANNLTALGVALRIHAMDHEGRFPANWLEASNEISAPLLLVCPEDGRHTAAPTWAEVGNANISYEYQGVGATNGDASRVIAQCPVHGHVMFADGHVAPSRENRRPATRR